MASEVVEIELDLTLSDGTVTKALAKIPRGAKKTGKESGKLFTEGFRNAVSSFVGNVGAIAFTRALDGIKNSISGVVSAAAKLEVFETQFKTILGSSKAAQKQLQDLQEFAAKTPFQIDGLALATRQLLSFGVVQEEVIPTLSQLGDIAAGVGASIDELTIPFGRLVSTQKLTLIELDKFADRGVNLYKALADGAGVSLKNIRDEISKGRVPFELFTKALNDLTQEGGTFFKGAEAQSKTLAGAISTLDDNFFNLQGTLGKTFNSDLIKIANEFTGIIQRLTATIIENGPKISENFSKAFDFFFVTPAKFWVDFFSGESLGLSQVESQIAAVREQIRLTEENIQGIDSATGAVGFIGQLFGGSDEAKLKLFELEEQLSGLVAKRDALKEDDSLGIPDISPAIDKNKAKIDELADKMKMLAKEAKKAFVNGFARSVGQGFAALGAALVNGENALKAFTKAFLASIGQTLISLGTRAILEGTYFSLNPAFGPAIGGPLIGAGIAMTAAGGALTAAVSGDSGGGATGGGGSSLSGSSIGADDDTFETLQNVEESGPSVTVNIQGDVLDSQESGSRIVNIINEAVDGEGVTINRNAIGAFA